MSDIAHHHLAVGVVFILAGHMYQTDEAPLTLLWR